MTNEERISMSQLDLSAEELLTTTRAVRHRLDFDRPVDPAVIRRCVEIAAQAPTGRNRQRWGFVVVTDPDRRAALADLWRAGLGRGSPGMAAEDLRRATVKPGSLEKVFTGLQHLTENLHRVPVLVVPTITGRTDQAGVPEQAGTWGSLLPAVWSFMLAARLHGLGTVWTTANLLIEGEVAELLGLPDDQMQGALIPVAHTIGTDFRAGPRVPVEEILHWERW